MVKIKRTDSDNKDFQNLIFELDKDLAIRNGEANNFFAQYNKTDQIKHVVIASFENIAVGCGAIKAYDNKTAEIKRMYVLPEMRGKGIAIAILQELEQWATELAYDACVLETGNKMSEAIGLYRKSHYKIIPNYGPYANVESSLCFEKKLKV